MEEKQLFQEDVKRIAIITEACSTGISLQVRARLAMAMADAALNSTVRCRGTILLMRASALPSGGVVYLQV